MRHVPATNNPIRKRNHGMSLRQDPPCEHFKKPIPATCPFVWTRAWNSSRDMSLQHDPSCEPTFTLPNESHTNPHGNVIRDVEARSRDTKMDQDFILWILASACCKTDALRVYASIEVGLMSSLVNLTSPQCMWRAMLKASNEAQLELRTKEALPFRGNAVVTRYRSSHKNNCLVSGTRMCLSDGHNTLIRQTPSVRGDIRGKQLDGVHISYSLLSTTYKQLSELQLQLTSVLPPNRHKVFTPKSDQCPLQPHHIDITSHSMKNLAFHLLLRWKMIILPILSLPHLIFQFKMLGECTFWTWEWEG